MTESYSTRYERIIEELTNQLNISYNEKLSKITNCKKAVITGAVGVGKTTILKKITETLSTSKELLVVPEYIDELPGASDVLMKYLKDEISSYEFQSYVSNYYADYLLSIADRITDDTILLFERIPDDALRCFLPLDRIKDRISFEDFRKLAYRIHKTTELFGLPCYENMADQSVLLLKTNSSPSVNSKIVSDFITDSEYKKVVIGLFNTVDDCYSRICQRGRESYSIDSVIYFNRCYSEIYKNLVCL